MVERAWCPRCEKPVPDDHDGSLCHICGKGFCEVQGDVQLGLCEDCLTKISKKQD